MIKPPRIVVWDWHGVLGLHGFWHKAANNDREVAALADYIFSSKATVSSWMRGEITIANLIDESGLKLTQQVLASHLLKDWGETDSINTQLVSAIKGIYPEARHIVVTDNMDVFSEYVKSNKYITKNFERIFNSSDYGLLKDDSPGLFEHVMTELSLKSLEGCLLLDDSTTNVQRFRELGGEAVLIDGGYR